MGDGVRRPRRLLRPTRPGHRGRVWRLVGVALAAATMTAVAGLPAHAEPARLVDVVPPGDTSTPDPLAAGVRQICDLVWVDGVCEQFGAPDPQYRTGTDPSADGALEQRVGVMHEHSGYSDGDPTSRPSDYFESARTGHNVADDGGDTGVVVDFLLSSEHSENEKIPVTTSAACLDVAAIPERLASLDVLSVPPFNCVNAHQSDHYRKWDETLAQAVDATVSDGGDDTGFTAMRGFEWTNDYYNHLGVYFSRHVVNAKVDGSYVAMDFFWNWLRDPVERGGGADALVVFNHPGSLPALTPFDGDLFFNQLLADTVGGGNWNDLALIPDVDDRVIGIEVNGGDDLFWYVKALQRGWHLGPVAAEDEHEREWSSASDGKTLTYTRGRGPRDYYFALSERRTVSLSPDLVDGAPGERAIVPTIEYWTGAPSFTDRDATVLGGRIEADTATLRFTAAGLPTGSQVVVVTDTSDEPISIGTADQDGAVATSIDVAVDDVDEHWWFVVTCGADVDDCGSGEDYDAVTAPIWVRATGADRAGRPDAVDGAASPARPDQAASTESAGTESAGAAQTRSLPATGSVVPVGLAVAMAGVGLVIGRRGRPARR